MTTYLVLSDFQRPPTIHLKAGALIDDANFTIPALLAAGLAVVVYDSSMTAPLTAWQASLPSNPGASLLAALTVAGKSFAPSTPTGFLSVIDFGAKADDPGDGTGKDNSAAFSACIVAAAVADMDVWVPAPGTGKLYRVAANVFLNSTDADITIDGSGYVLCDTGPATPVFTFANCARVHWKVGTIGKLGNLSADCLHVVEFEFCREAFFEARVTFLLAEDAIVYHTETGFSGLDVLMDGACGRNGNVRGENWSSHVMERFKFVDVNQGGSGKVGTNPGQGFPAQWFLLGEVRAPLTGGFSQQPLVFRNGELDESASRLIKVASTTYRVASCVIEDVRGSSFLTNTPQPGFDISNVDVLHMTRSGTKRLSTNPGVSDCIAISLKSVKRAVLDGCEIATRDHDANIISIDAACGLVEILNMQEGVNYKTLTTAAPVMRPPSTPLLGDGIINWTITPGTGGGIVTGFALLRNGVPTGQLFAATGSPISFAKPVEVGPLWTVIGYGPGGASSQSTTPQGGWLSTGGVFARALEGSSYIGAPSDGSTAFLVWTASGLRRVEDRGDGLGVALLMEKAATNSLRQSRALTNPAWTDTASATIVADQANGPDGALLADQIFAGLANFTSIFQESGPAGVVTGTAWQRAFSGTQNLQAILLSNGATGVVAAKGVLAAPTTYQRLSVTGTAVTDSGFDPFDGRDQTAHGGIVGTAVNEYSDLAQLEAGPYPTSVIRTTTVAVTRPADTLSYLTGTYDPLLLTSGGVIDFAFDAASAEIITANEDWRFMQVGANDYVRVRKNGAGCDVDLVCGGVIVATRTITFSRGQRVTITAKPSAGSLTVALATTGNGTTVGAGAAWPAGQTMFIGGDNAGANNVTGRFLGAAIAVAA